MDDENTQGTPLYSSMDLAMNGERPPIQHNNTPTPEMSGTWESQGNSQTEVDLNKYNESLTPPTSSAIDNWDKNMKDSPSIVVAHEKETPPVQPVIPERDLHQEALDSNKKANEGFVSGPVLSNTGTSFFQREDIYAENAKLREDIEELKRQVTELTQRFDDPNALQNALDPNKERPLNPLKEVQQTLLKEESERQRKFAQDVENERLQHDPTYNPDLITPDVPPITPEVPPITPEVPPVTPEVQKKQRDFRTAALIAGVISGGTAAILGGTTVGIPVAAAAGVISIGSKITNHFVGKSINKIGEQLEDTTLDVETRARLEKRHDNLKKVQNVVAHLGKFFTGAAIGAGIGNFISMKFMAGHGLVWNRPELTTPTPVTPEGSPITKDQMPIDTNPNPTPEFGSVEPYPGNSLIQDGHVNLPGSAWNGNMASNPTQDILAGGADNFSNYSGGIEEMAAHKLGLALQKNYVTDELLRKLSTPETHQLLNQFKNAISSGTPNPDLVQALNNIGTPGAQDLVQALGK